MNRERKIRRLKKKFHRQEKLRIKSKVQKIRSIVNEVLVEEFDRRLYNLKADDELRLLTLFTWRDRYKVSVKYILKLLIPIWTRKFSRFRVKTSLGCRVATLVGNKSEEILRERIAHDFPNKENIQQYDSIERDKIIQYATRHENKNKAKREDEKSLLEYKNINSFIHQYKRDLRWKKKKSSSKSQKLLEQVKTKQYRNNPFQ
jgi:hypothetical protein